MGGLSDNDVLSLRRMARESTTMDYETLSKPYGLTPATLEKAVRGGHFKHLNAQEPPVIRVIKKEDARLKAIALYDGGKGKSYNVISKELGVSKSSLSLWLRSFAPVVKTKPKRNISQDVIDEVRRLYNTGLTTLDISKSLKISNRRIAEWCADLIAEQRLLRKKKPRKTKKRVVSGLQILTDQNVIDMRREVKNSQEKNWKTYAERYKVSISVISMAVRGKTFKHLNIIEPPITDLKSPLPPVQRKEGLSESLIADLIAKRYADTAVWTFRKLAEWVSEQVSETYSETWVRVFLTKRDPSLKEVKGRKGPKPRTDAEKDLIKKNNLSLMKELNEARKEKKKKEAEELREAIRRADLYEQWVEAGQPDNWVWE